MRYSKAMDKEKKIVYIITKSSWGGAQQYVYDLATRVPAGRFDVAVAAGGDGMLFDRLATVGIRTIPITALDRDVGVFREFRAFGRIWRLLLRERPDIVHLSSSKAGALAAPAAKLAALALGKKIRVVFTAHGWGFREDRPLIQRIAIYAVSFIASLFQNDVILVSAADEGAARAFIPRRKLHLIFNGLPETDTLPRPEARAALAKKIGLPIPDSMILIGTIAELTKNKGISYLVLAARLLRSHFNNFLVVIIGAGEERPLLKQQIRDQKLDDVVFLAGLVPDAQRLLPAFDIFALSSLKEGLPYAVMEAMAAGLPVVATAVGGLTDLVSDGVSGLLVPPKDAGALAGAVEKLARSPGLRSSFGRAAQERIRTHFDFRAMLNRTIAVYESRDSV